MTDSWIRNVLRLIEAGAATEVTCGLGLSRATFYRRIRELPTPELSVHRKPRDDIVLSAGVFQRSRVAGVVVDGLNGSQGAA